MKANGFIEALNTTKANLPFAVGILLMIHGGLVAWSATCHTPVVDEVGHLTAGLSHWKERRFDLYKVNPPLIRCLASGSLFFSGEPIDLAGNRKSLLRRYEFSIGSRWMQNHPERIMPAYRVARWTCLPLAILGAYVCFRWAQDFYGRWAGLISLTLWCFSPTLLGHASLITPDAGAAAIGVTACYVFWRWMNEPTKRKLCLTGLLLGLTLLTKFTWLVLLLIWPAGWAIRLLRSCPGQCKKPTGNQADQPELLNKNLHPQRAFKLPQLVVVLGIAWLVFNTGYLWEEVFRPLGEFSFSSQVLRGEDPEGRRVLGNRFHGTILGSIPFPGPRNFLNGIDHIKIEYEDGYPSYLRGETRFGGWWYYYLYAMLVKMPVGTIKLITIALITAIVDGVGRMKRTTDRSVAMAGAVRPRGLDEVYLLAPAVAILVLVSSETGFNHHLRYVLPAFPFLFIFAGRTALLFHSRRKLVKAIPLVCVLATVASSLSVYPHSLSYFNEPSGGSINGWRHLDQSNVDWGQDLLYAKEWSDAHPEARPLYVAATGYVDPKLLGIPCEDARWSLRPHNESDKTRIYDFPPGWYILGLTQLVNPANPIHCFLQEEPVGYIGYSMRVYHIPERKVPKEK